MGTCIIFCAGGFDQLAEPVRQGDYVIAADGGLRYTRALGLNCDAILGDFDSLGYAPAGANVFPVEKDDTDAMLAVRHGLSAGYRRFVIYGSLDGPRLDHTIANLQTLQFLADAGAAGYLVGLNYMATVIKNETVFFPETAKGILSLFCMGADAAGVTLEGLQYPLTGAILSAGFPLGVSNHFTGQKAAVTVKNGSLLALFDRQNGFPLREDKGGSTP